MSASQIHAVMEAHVLMGWLPLHVCVSQATLGFTVRKVSSLCIGFLLPNKVSLLEMQLPHIVVYIEVFMT